MYYKLTEFDMSTSNHADWEVMLWRLATTPRTKDLSSSGWIHFYDDPFLAVILNPSYKNFKHPRLFEIECEGKVINDKGLYFGARKVRLTREVSVPKISIEVKARIAKAVSDKSEALAQEMRKEILGKRQQESDDIMLDISRTLNFSVHAQYYITDEAFGICSRQGADRLECLNKALAGTLISAATWSKGKINIKKITRQVILNE